MSSKARAGGRRGYHRAGHSAVLRTGGSSIVISNKLPGKPGALTHRDHGTQQIEHRTPRGQTDGAQERNFSFCAIRRHQGWRPSRGRPPYRSWSLPHVPGQFFSPESTEGWKSQVPGKKDPHLDYTARISPSSPPREPPAFYWVAVQWRNGQTSGTRVQAVTVTQGPKASRPPPFLAAYMGDK